MGMLTDCALAWLGGYIQYTTVSSEAKKYGTKKNQYAVVEHYPRFRLYRVEVLSDSDYMEPHSYYGYNSANFWHLTKEGAMSRADELNKNIC